jgi:hypothetical protein
MDLFVGGRTKAVPRHFHAEVSSGYSESMGLASEIFTLFKKWYVVVYGTALAAEAV